MVCGVLRRLHDSHCSELKTTLGKGFYCRDRWKACKCSADASRYVSPLMNYSTDANTGDLPWLHAEFGATTPKRVMDRLLPTSSRDSHVTIRNHTVAVGKSLQHTQPVRQWCEETKPKPERGIDVGYVRQARSNGKGAGKDNRAGTGNESSSIAMVDSRQASLAGPCERWRLTLAPAHCADIRVDPKPPEERLRCRLRGTSSCLCHARPQGRTCRLITLKGVVLMPQPIIGMPEFGRDSDHHASVGRPDFRCEVIR